MQAGVLLLSKQRTFPGLRELKALRVMCKKGLGTQNQGLTSDKNLFLQIANSKATH